MSIRHIGWVVLLLTWAPVAGAAETAACDPWAAKMASVQGSVEAKRVKSDQWQAAKLNEIFCPGDSIRVGSKGRAGIILANETLVRLDQNTAITLTSIEKESPSLLEILKGIAHFISRVPRSLKVNTPFVNAAIEGTEFVVAVINQQTTVTVFEGTVLTQNSLGEVRITNGESIVASKGSAPSKILLAKPRDAVQWALYFPPVIAAGKGMLSDASDLLNAGRISEAQQLLAKINSGEARALQAIIAVVNNDKDTAFELATQALEQAPQSAAVHIAMSYVWQAKLNLNDALASASTATKHEANNAIAQARLAELQLSVGELDAALASAQRATQLNDKLSRTQTILGYAYLVRIDIDNAMASFNKAIALDQADPLPHLGLGLAKIRKNELQQGRREIEVAALLDPNNAIIRSYLGKAYFEEKRGPLDATQFDMAKVLDPNDPTPYFYDAIRKQSENNPVGALADLNKSIELNDNRAVYRSSLQLDQDEAARNVSQARIYSDLGFEQLALLEGWKSVAIAPANHATHRFLADSYSALPRHEIARVSELLQSQLLQPLNTVPLQPQLGQSDLGILSGTGPSSAAFNEYNSLFTRDETRVQLDMLSGGNDTFAEDIVVAGMGDNSAFSLGQFHYGTDGYRANNHLKHDIVNFFMQHQFSPRSSLQLEYRDRKTEMGDRSQDITGSFSTANNRQIDTDATRLGYHYKLSSNSDILFSISDNNETDTTHIERNQGIVFPFPNPLILNLDTTTKQDGLTSELQYITNTYNYNLIAGMGQFAREEDTRETTQIITGGAPLGIPTTTLTTDNRQNNNAYIYSTLKTSPGTNIILGASYDDFNSTILKDRSTFSPKLGLISTLSENITIRLAAFRALTRATLNTSSIEPAQIAGFNQYFDDFDGVISERYGLGLDYKPNKKLSYGLEFTGRNMKYAPSGIDRNLHELLHRLYMYYTLSNSASLAASYINDSYETETVFPTLPDMVRTQSLPIEIIINFDNGLKTGVKATGIEQDVRLSGTDYNETFVVTDIWLGYRLPKRQGSVNLLVKNAFDKQFNFQNRSFQTSDPEDLLYVPDRTVYLQLNLTL